MSWLSKFWSELLSGALAKVIAAFVFPLIWWIVTRFFRGQRAIRVVENALAAVQRVNRDGLRFEGDGIWLRAPVNRPRDYSRRQQLSKPIIMVANLKGGVGKTTLAGNLGAMFAIKHNKRVLLIDLDYQGSLSSMAVTDTSRVSQPSKANRLISGDISGDQVTGFAEALSRPGMQQGMELKVISAFYDLAQAENRLLLEWQLPWKIDWFSKLKQLIGMEQAPVPPSHGDARYHLAELLLEPQVQQSFDFVIIDAPPRLSTAHIQAFCAATHVIIPSILDRLAGEAVAYFLGQIATHKLGPGGNEERAICPNIKVIGVVGNLIPAGVNIDGPANVLRASIQDNRLGAELLPVDCFVKQRPPYREHAGERLAYAATNNDQAHRDLREELDRLGEEILRRI